MTQPTLQPLAYAAEDTRPVRLPWLLVIWCVLAGVFVALRAGEFIHSTDARYFIEFNNPFRASTGPQPEATIRGLVAWHDLTEYLAGVLLLVIGIIAACTRRAASSAVIALLATAAAVLLVGQLALTAIPYVELFGYPESVFSPDADFSSLQYAELLVSRLCNDLLPPVLLGMAASRRFLTHPHTRRRWIAIAIGTWALALGVTFADQLIRWPLGTTPYWLPDPESPPAGGQTLVELLRIWSWPVLVPIALAAARQLRRPTPNGRAWILAFAVIWTIAIMSRNVWYLLGGDAYGFFWSNVIRSAVPDWFTLPVALIPVIAPRPPQPLEPPPA